MAAESANGELRAEPSTASAAPSTDPSVAPSPRAREIQRFAAEIGKKIPNMAPEECEKTAQEVQRELLKSLEDPDKAALKILLPLGKMSGVEPRILERAESILQTAKRSSTMSMILDDDDFEDNIMVVGNKNGVTKPKVKGKKKPSVARRSKRASATALTGSPSEASEGLPSNTVATRASQFSAEDLIKQATGAEADEEPPSNTAATRVSQLSPEDVVKQATGAATIGAAKIGEVEISRTLLEKSKLDAGPTPGVLKKYWCQFEQQQVRPSRGPLIWYGRRPQAICAGSCALMFILLASVLLSVCINQVVVPYTSQHIVQEFDVPEGLRGPVHVSYELPNLLLNHKSAVAGKDKFLWSPPIVNDYTCKPNAETIEEASWRRPEPAFNTMLTGGGVLPNYFRPCGLVAIAMFIDDFKLVRKDGAPVLLDETKLALDMDEQIYNNKVLPINGKTESSHLPHYTIDGQNSWLRIGAQFEHFKVWYRTSAAALVRNLWARIPDGLEAGKYTLNFTVNSPIWSSSWGVEEKRIILSESHILGNAAACKVLGVFCIIIGVCEALMTVGFMFAPSRVTS